MSGWALVGPIPGIAIARPIRYIGRVVVPDRQAFAAARAPSGGRRLLRYSAVEDPEADVLERHISVGSAK
jgi:hypothetical protein